MSFDFDQETQQHFEKIVIPTNISDWNAWFQFESVEEYKDYVLKNTDLDSVENLWVLLNHVQMDSKDLSIEKNDFITSYTDPHPLILCHSSGTTNSDLSALKWFHMSEDVIKRYWAPGMKAIFESSGLDSKKSAIIFVPSRLKTDGMNKLDGKKYCSLYSAEFSQRVMLSAIKPKNYLLNEYKNSRSLVTISKILSMEKIAVISAPALTILGWANLENLKIGIEKSLTSIEDFDRDPILKDLLKIIKEEGLNSGAKIIQKRLSEKLSEATIIFSISSLSKPDWELINKFMKWQNGKERFTNLYVASEIGPIASSLGDFKVARSNSMYVFPLFLPIVKYKNTIEFITDSSHKTGNLLISKTDKGRILLNINIGDVISTEKQTPLPQINGKILRSSFKLKYQIKLHDSIEPRSNYSVYAGDYFECPNFDIIEPRNTIHCLNRKLNQENIDSMVFLTSNQGENSEKRLIIPVHATNYEEEMFFQCLSSNSLINAIKENEVLLELNSNELVTYMEDRGLILEKVRKGALPKGILKKWPLYVILLKE